MISYVGQVALSDFCKEHTPAPTAGAVSRPTGFKSKLVTSIILSRSGLATPLKVHSGLLEQRFSPKYTSKYILLHIHKKGAPGKVQVTVACEVTVTFYIKRRSHV